MKKYSLFIIAAALSLSACSVKVSTDDKDQKEAAKEAGTQAGPKVAKVTDPECGMTREAGENWTEYTVKGSDTSWFCSPHCKEAYGKKHPEPNGSKPEEKKG